MIIYLVYFFPLKERKMVKLETFNEITTVVLMYHLMCFSNFVPEAETRNQIGFSFIGIASMNILVHFYLLARENVVKLKEFCGKAK